LLLRAWGVSGEAADFADLDGFSAFAPRPNQAQGPLLLGR
jgi:hypothetical protein